jgi:hypothetical protein
MTFSLNRTEFDSKRLTLKSEGIVVPEGDSGILSFQRVIAFFSYSEPNTLLTITVADYGGHLQFFVDAAIKHWFLSTGV